MQFLSPGQALADYTKMDPHPFPDAVTFNWSPQGIIATCDLSGRYLEATESDYELATQALAVRIMREAFQQDAQDLFYYFKDRYLSGTFPDVQRSCVLSEQRIAALKHQEYISSSMASHYVSPQHQPHVVVNHKPLLPLLPPRGGGDKPPLPPARPQGHGTKPPLPPVRLQGGVPRPPLPPSQLDNNGNLRTKPTSSGSQVTQLPGSLANSFVRAGETSKNNFIPDQVAKTQPPRNSSVPPAAVVTTGMASPPRNKLSRKARKRAFEELKKKGQDAFSTGANTIPLKQRKFPLADEATISNATGSPIPPKSSPVIKKEVPEGMEPYFVNFGASENGKIDDAHISPMKKSSSPVCDEEHSPVKDTQEESDDDSGVDDPTISVVFNNLKSKDPLRVCLAMSIQGGVFKINNLRARQEMSLKIKKSNEALFEELVILKSRHSEADEAASSWKAGKWKDICSFENRMMNQAAPPTEAPCTEAYLRSLMARIDDRGKLEFMTTEWDEGRLVYVTLRPQDGVSGRRYITFHGKGKSSLEASIHACCAALDFLSREAVFGVLVAPNEGRMERLQTALDESSDGREALLSGKLENKMTDCGFFRSTNKVDSLEAVARQSLEATSEMHLQILRKYGGILHYNDYESQTLTEVPLLKMYRFAPFKEP